MSEPFQVPESVQRLLLFDRAPTPPLDEFMAAYEHDSNLVWRIDSGHIINLLDNAWELIQELRSQADPVSLDAYRKSVIETVPCPLCKAQPGQFCRKPGGSVVAYVHDDRSHLHRLTLPT